MTRRPWRSIPDDDPVYDRPGRAPPYTGKPWKSPRLGATKGFDGRYHKVLENENNGKYLDVQYVDETGEVVVGVFRRIGWGWAPSKERAETADMVGDALREGKTITVSTGEK